MIFLLHRLFIFIHVVLVDNLIIRKDETKLQMYLKRKASNVHACLCKDECVRKLKRLV